MRWAACSTVVAVLSFTACPNQPVSSPPDLQVSSITATPATVSITDAWELGATITNQGSGASDAATVSFYFSTDSMYDAGDTLIGNRPVPALAPAATSYVLYDAAYTIESTAPGAGAGTYYIIAVVDQPNSVGESDESNNEASRSIQIAAPTAKPDLVVSAITSTSPVFLADTRELGATIKNQGTSASAGATVAFYYSDDSVFDSGTDTLIGTASIPALAVDESQYVL